MTLVLCPRCAKRMTDSDLCLSCRLEGFDATRPTPAELADHGNGD